jgi:molybdenum cofactor cytidylyltransferase
VSKRLACVVLAAGEGRRFGGRKQLAALDGRPLIAHVVAMAAPWDPIVVLGAHADEIRPVVDAPRIVVAEDWAEGQAASLRAGLRAAGDVDWLLVLLADMPFVTRAVVEGVLGAREPDVDAVRATYDGRPGHPWCSAGACWRASRPCAATPARASC